MPTRGSCPLFRNESVSSKFVALLMLRAIVWLPASNAPAGNLDLSFRGRRGTVWIGFGRFAATLVFCVLICALSDALLRRVRTA